MTLAEILDAAAREAIRAALRRHNGNQTAAAVELGLHRNRLADRIEALGLAAEAAAYTRSDRQPPPRRSAPT